MFCDNKSKKPGCIHNNIHDMSMKHRICVECAALRQNRNNLSTCYATPPQVSNRLTVVYPFLIRTLIL
ncbi:hypothetical protein QTP88_021927 [Uroleucon formosanum]